MSTTAVEDRSANAADQLPLAGLEVHPANDPPFRPRVVVLHEVQVDPRRLEDVAAIALQEEPALVTMDDGFDQPRCRERCGGHLHERRF